MVIEIRNVQTLDGKKITHAIESKKSQIIEAEGLTMLPALIDPHVHFRVPGAEHKETWETGSKAAIAGGVTTVCDMPNNFPSTSTLERLEAKEKKIQEQLQQSGIPLRYRLYLGANSNHFQEIGKTKQSIAGLKIYMGSSTGDLLLCDLPSLEEAFRIAAQEGVLVAVHAEDEHLIQLNRSKHVERTDAAVHSVIRSPEAAAKSVALAIALAKKHGARLYIVHVSSKEELQLIRAAKREGCTVYAEVAPHHLFMDENAYRSLGTQALVNPPLREKSNCEALWEAISDGTIDTIGTDHAPHTLEEKRRPFGAAPSGFPSIELYLSLLLNAYHEKKISLEQIVSLTHTRPREIFGFPVHSDVVLVDLSKTKQIDDARLHTKAKWSPYTGRILQGWPRYTILDGTVFDLELL